MAMGTVGLSSADPVEQISPDLEAIYQGGQFFLDRMKAMGDARDYAKNALDALNLGKDIAAAQAKAQSDLAAAAAAKADAVKAIGDAKVQADKIVAAAKATAQAIVDTANTVAADLDTKSALAKKKNDKEIADSNAAAAAALADALAKQNDIAALTQAANAALAEAAAIKAQADAATKAAAQAVRDAKSIYQDKLAKIQAAIG